MPQLVWEPLDFLDVLGVAPEIADYETSHKYVIPQPPVRLEITLWQYDGDVQLHLFVAPFEQPVVRYAMLGSPGVRVVDDKRGRFPEFAAANTFTGRYDGYSVIPYGLRVWVTPQVCLEPFVYPNKHEVYGREADDLIRKIGALCSRRELDEWREREIGWSKDAGLALRKARTRYLELAKRAKESGWETR